MLGLVVEEFKGVSGLRIFGLRGVGFRGLGLGV